MVAAETSLVRLGTLTSYRPFARRDEPQAGREGAQIDQVPIVEILATGEPLTVFAEITSKSSPRVQNVGRRKM